MDNYGYKEGLKPIGWKYPDPTEDERWVYDEEDYREIKLNGGEVLDVHSHECSACGEIVINYHIDTAFRDYDYVQFDNGIPYCPPCFYELEDTEGV